MINKNLKDVDEVYEFLYELKEYLKNNIENPVTMIVGGSTAISEKSLFLRSDLSKSDIDLRIYIPNTPQAVAENHFFKFIGKYYKKKFSYECFTDVIKLYYENTFILDIFLNSFEYRSCLKLFFDYNIKIKQTQVFKTFSNSDGKIKNFSYYIEDYKIAYFFKIMYLIKLSEGIFEYDSKNEKNNEESFIKHSNDLEKLYTYLQVAFEQQLHKNKEKNKFIDDEIAF